MKNIKAQVTIFIIIALIIVAGIVFYFAFRKPSVEVNGLPSEIEPIYQSFLSCLEEKTLTGVDILETKGGYIENPDFVSGSTYMPFSSELNFAGVDIPYWYYVTGNNIQKEQMPSKKEMQEQLSDFIKQKARTCVFDKFYDDGFTISQAEPEEINVRIEDNKIFIDMEMDLSIEGKNQSVLLKDHNLEIDSNLGNLYDSAVNVYNYAKSTMFLENYGVDVIRLYAPVDGIELTCAPKIWNADEIFEELKTVIQANTLSLKSKKGDYELHNDEDKYFVVDLPVDNEVRFINSENWPYSFEVSPSEGPLLMAEPVGNQAGLGVMGFCYAPYHFVYDIKYPVLVQVYSGDDASEIFQFPFAVVIDNNVPRESLDATAYAPEVSELCNYKNTLTKVNLYDSRLNKVDADISYECSGTKCYIGKTSQGSLTGYFPQCVNGKIVVKEDGFKDKTQIYSAIESGSVDIILDRVYNQKVDLKLDGLLTNKNAIISFVSKDDSKTIYYPSQKEIELGEGQYNVTVQIFENSSLRLEETVKEQCVEVPKSGLGGVFGLTDKKCFDLKIPSQIISNVLIGGGTQEHYITETELMQSSVIEINAESLTKPKTIEDLQQNYILFEDKGLDIYLK